MSSEPSVPEKYSGDISETTSYSEAADYWEKIEPTVDGMLGGFGKISTTDIDGSNKFLKNIMKLDPAPGNERALDCGAGIGRITKHLLFRHFNTVDLVEQNGKFLEQADKYLGESPKRGDLHHMGLQDFTPKKEFYDVIWCQWVLGHLKDKDLIAFFRRAGLKPNGLLIVKENLTTTGEVEKDEEDSSVTRPHEVLKELFEAADLELIRDLLQTKFPSELYPVRMFALRDKKKEGEDEEKM